MTTQTLARTAEEGSTSQSDDVLILQGVTKRYGKSVALEPTDLRVQKGEFLTLLGPSGSGKSTLLKLIAGFEAPTAGSIHLRSREISGLSPADRQLGMVFQSYSLFPNMTVTKNVEYGLARRRWPADKRRERAAEMLDLVKLTHRANALPEELSGGQQQRVALARAIAYNPDVLLMDEPLGALDRTLRLEMEFEMKRIHAELGSTFIYVTHDQQEAMHLSTRVAIMKDAKIVALDSPNALFRRPNNRFVAEFFSDATLFAAEVTDAGMLTFAASDRAWALPFEKPRGSCVLGIRPRTAHVARPGDSDAVGPTVEGVVTSVMMFGDEMRVVLETQGGQVLRATMPSRNVQVRQGEAARVRIPWDEIILLDGE